MAMAAGTQLSGRSLANDEALASTEAIEALVELTAPVSGEVVKIERAGTRRCEASGA
jgi:glycine cleavage system H lipoate-binding protein